MGDDERNLRMLRRDLGPKLQRIDEHPIRVITEGIYSKSKLGEHTETASLYENMFKYALLHNPTDILYSPLRLPVKAGRNNMPIDTYTPDFWLPFCYINNKSVVIDPHGADIMHSEYMEKLRRARKQYNIYIILSSTSYYGNPFFDIRNEIGSSIDEFWMIRNNYRGMRVLKEKIKNLLSTVQISENDSLQSALKGISHMYNERVIGLLMRSIQNGRHD